MVLIFTLYSCSTNEPAVNIQFTSEIQKHTFSVKDLNKDLPADWTDYGYLTFDMLSSTTQRFELSLIDTSGPRRVNINPFQGAMVRVSIPLIHFQQRNTRGNDMASIGKTSRPGYWIGFSGAVGSIKKIDSLRITMRLTAGDPTLTLNNFRLTMQPEDTILSPIPLVDEFGQWIPDEWPGKAKTIEDLKKAWSEEESSLNEGGLKISAYGGFIDKKVRATGFFRLEKIDGRWWFIDPEGYLFFSAGSTCISPRSSDFARIRGREYIFTALPPSDISEPGSRQGGRGDNASFYSWNLSRRFGDNWYEKWKDLTVRRMDNWGLNTIANWSDPTIGRTNNKPYVASLGGWGSGADYMGMPDVYVNNYEALVDSAVSRQTSVYRDDPYLIGYFIGNEPPWPGREQELARVILGGKDTPMKKALERFIEKGDSPQLRKEFVYNTYSRFIDIVNRSIKKYDPNHLNMGMRYGGGPTDELIKASKDHFDVFSLNIYGYDAKPDLIQKIYDITGLPVVIGEFHFGTPGRGLAPGLAQVADYNERGVAYRYYVENAAAHPAVIGTHWFQWIDQASTGRFDGENYNIGFIDITDRPYPEMIKASRETFERLYSVHAGTELPVSRKAVR